MFNKLKLQFIFTNIAIVFVLFFLITTGAYFLVRTNMISHTLFFSKRLAEGINSGMFPDLPPFDRHMPMPIDNRNLARFRDLQPFVAQLPKPTGNRSSGMFGNLVPRENLLPYVFFVKTNLSGMIFFRTARQPFNSNQLTKLVQQTLKTTKTSGIIQFLNGRYFYFKAPLRKQPGRLIVFQDFKPERNMLHFLILSLSIIGFVCLLLSLCGSLFMANRAIIPIQKVWQQQKDFIADASHELRTPLAIIQTNLEIVLRNQHETVASQNDWIVSVKEEAQHMTDLVTSLLFLARADSNQLVLNKKDFSLNQVIVQVGKAFKPIVVLKELDLCVQIAKQITGYGDESQIRQVIEILLDNAVRHTPIGGKVSLSLSETDQRILLTVADTGEGIAPEYLEKIFDRFYQIDNSRSKGELGLGLSIAKCIIENHGGTIYVASELGSGTKFTIELPLPKNNNM